MNIHLEYAVTLNEYHEFQMAYLRHRKSLTSPGKFTLLSPRPLIILAFIAMLLAAEFIIPFFTASPAPAAAPAPAAPAPAPISLGDFAAALAPYLVVFVLFLLFFLWLRRSRFTYRRFFEEQQKLAEPHFTDITGDKITIRQAGSINAMEWSYFIRCIETKSDFILFQSGRMGHIVPKRAFPTPESLAEFRAFALSHVGNQPIGFPVQPPRDMQFP